MNASDFGLSIAGQLPAAVTPIRSNRAEVRNPVLALPAARRIQALPLDVRQVLADLLRDLAADARARAEKCWRTHKAPMALYWKCVAVYCGHIARALVRP